MSAHKYTVCVVAFDNQHRMLVGNTRYITECGKLVIPSGEVMYGEPLIAATRVMRDDCGVRVDKFYFVETIVGSDETVYVYSCKIDADQENRVVVGPEAFVDKWEWRNVEHVSRRQGICGQRLSSLLAAIKLLLREMR